jgi:L-threonylcarbamoyladenylate synthase
VKTLITKSNIDAVANIILSGGVAAVPTETVYGLAVNALDVSAVERLYEVKGRPETKPISLFVSGMADAESFCQDIPEGAYKLAERFWSGPLTIVLKRKPIVPDIITAGGDTVAVRSPKNDFVLGLLKKLRLPLTGTSANLSGMPSAVSFEDTLKYFDGKIDCAVDGGVCPGGIPSTIVDMTGEIPKILRAGGIEKAEIEALLGQVAE